MRTKTEAEGRADVEEEARVEASTSRRRSTLAKAGASVRVYVQAPAHADTRLHALVVAQQPVLAKTGMRPHSTHSETMCEQLSGVQGLSGEYSPRGERIGKRLESLPRSEQEQTKARARPDYHRVGYAQVLTMRVPLQEYFADLEASSHRY